MLVTDNVSGTCRSRMAVRFISCRVMWVYNRYVIKLVLKNRILVFKLDFKIDLLQMTLNFMLLQDSCVRPIRVRSKVIILNITDNLGPNMTYVHIGSKLITKNETDSYIPIFLVLFFFSDCS